MLVALLISAVYCDSLLKSGPMLANVEAMEISIWFETTEPATVEVVYWAEGSPEKIHVSRALETSEERYLTGTIKLVNLLPETRYEYQLSVNGEAIERPYATKFKTQAYWQWRKDPSPFDVLIGSCMYMNDPPFDRPGESYGTDLKIIEAMVITKADFMLWLGDSLYFREPEVYSHARLNYRMSRNRAMPELQPLLAAYPHYATWDDHDYGPNDSDRSYREKYKTLDLFRAYWPNPSAGTPQTPGVFTSFTYQDVDFFMLDDRFHRAPNDDLNPDKDFLGKEQLKWLMDGLNSSKASFKIVIVGNQIHNDRSHNESYAHFTGEYARFRQWLDTSGVEGVLFLSGDRHFTELIKIERVGLYPIYEYTSSPLTSGVYKTLQQEVVNPVRIKGTLVHKENNYGTLSFSGPRNNRALTMRCFSVSGGLLWEHSITQSELKIVKPNPEFELDRGP